MITGKIIFEQRPPITQGEEYWYSDIETNVEYDIIDSYEKHVGGTKSRHFFLIRHDDGPLIEIPLSTYFKFTTYDE